MTQQPSFFPLAQRALDTASTIQMLHEGGYKILDMRITKNDASIQIEFSPKTKKLRGTSCGSTYIHNATYAVYQADVNGVLVRWLEPYFDAKASAKKVHFVGAQASAKKVH